MSPLLFAVVFAACVTSRVTCQTLTCTEDVCKTLVCPSAEPCAGRVFPNATLCNCCPLCVVPTGQGYGVGWGGRCGPPTYLSCEANLECRQGTCEYPAVGKPCGPPPARQCEEYLECYQGTCQHKRQPN